jgi:hypothetical protein
MRVSNRYGGQSVRTSSEECLMKSPSRAPRAAESTALLDEIFLQPWFVSQNTAVRIKNCLPVEYRHKMRFFFEDYGCLKCCRKRVQYGANAMCKACVAQIKLRFVFAIKRRWIEGMGAIERRPHAINRMAEAQRLLQDIAESSLANKKVIRRNRDSSIASSSAALFTERRGSSSAYNAFTDFSPSHYPFGGFLPSASTRRAFFMSLFTVISVGIHPGR